MTLLILIKNSSLGDSSNFLQISMYFSSLKRIFSKSFAESFTFYYPS